MCTALLDGQHTRSVVRPRPLVEMPLTGRDLCKHRGRRGISSRQPALMVELRNRPGLEGEPVVTNIWIRHLPRQVGRDAPAEDGLYRVRVRVRVRVRARVRAWVRVRVRVRVRLGLGLG